MMRPILLLKLLEAMVDRSYLGQRLPGFRDFWTWLSKRWLPLRAGSIDRLLHVCQWQLPNGSSRNPHFALCVVKDAQERYIFVPQRRWEASCCIRPSRN